MAYGTKGIGPDLALRNAEIIFTDFVGPIAAIYSAPDIVDFSSNTYQFELSFTDESGVLQSSFENNNTLVQITDGGTYSQLATFVSLVDLGDGNFRATFQIMAPADNGLYDITVLQGILSDILGNANNADQFVGSFSIVRTGPPPDPITATLGTLGTIHFDQNPIQIPVTYSPPAGGSITPAGVMAGAVEIHRGASTFASTSVISAVQNGPDVDAVLGIPKTVAIEWVPGNYTIHQTSQVVGNNASPPVAGQIGAFTIGNMREIPHGQTGSDLWFRSIVSSVNGDIYSSAKDSPDVLRQDAETGILTFLPTGRSSTKKWSYGTEAGNNRIYFLGRDVDSLLEIDPANSDTLREITMGGGSFGWIGLAEASNGRLYAAPRDEATLLEYDVANDVITLIPIPGIGLGPNRYAQIIACGDYVICVPLSVSGAEILVYNVTTGTPQLIATGESGVLRWAGVGKTADETFVYMLPQRSGTMIALDMLNLTITLVPVASDNNRAKWLYAINIGNHIVGSPFQEDAIFHYNKNAAPGSELNLAATGQGNDGIYNNLDETHDGRAIFAPRNAASAAIYDPATQIVTFVPMPGSSTDRWDDVVALADRRARFTPRNADVSVILYVE